jgi:RNA polymerase primary sigma factor
LPFTNNFVVEDGNLGLYLRDIARYKPLPPPDELKMASRIKNGDKKALDRLVKANLRFVVSVARNYQNQGMSLVDLINEGNLGLIKAAKRFDENKNFKFISYAVWWIRQAILQGLADHSRIVKVPLNRVATIHKVGKTSANLEQKYNRLPNMKEVADALGITEDDVADSLKIGSTHSSLDAPLSDEKGSLMDLMVDSKVEKPDDYAIRRSQNKEVDKILAILNKREREVIRLYFGIGEDTSYTLDEIGKRSGITRERVRQIKDIALRKLRRSKMIKHLMQYAK